MSQLSLSHPRALMQHITDRVLIDPETRCHIWQEGVSSQGAYPVCWIDDKCMYVYRAVYQLTHGDLPAGDPDHSSDSLEVHHRCENRRCCNPAHLELITRTEHNARHREARMRAQDAKLPWAAVMARGGFPAERIERITKLPKYLVREVIRQTAAVAA